MNGDRSPQLTLSSCKGAEHRSSDPLEAQAEDVDPGSYPGDSGRNYSLINDTLRSWTLGKCMNHSHALLTTCWAIIEA